MELPVCSVRWPRQSRRILNQLQGYRPVDPRRFELKTTLDNVRVALSGECYAVEKMYPTLFGICDGVSGCGGDADVLLGTAGRENACPAV